jgi:hypothetical protein
MAQKTVFPTTSNPEFNALPPAGSAAMGADAGAADDHRRARWSVAGTNVPSAGHPRPLG